MSDTLLYNSPTTVFKVNKPKGVKTLELLCYAYISEVAYSTTSSGLLNTRKDNQCLLFSNYMKQPTTKFMGLHVYI